MRIPMTRFGWKHVVDTYKTRKRVGMKRAFVYVNFRSFLKGYSLFVPLMTAGLHDAKRFFMFPCDYWDYNDYKYIREARKFFEKLKSSMFPQNPHPWDRYLDEREWKNFCAKNRIAADDCKNCIL